MYVRHVTQQLEFLPAQTRFLHAGTGLLGFFLMEVSFFTSHSLTDFFLTEVLFFSAKHPDPPIMGASDIGHGFTWPETGIQAWELNPGPIKIKPCMVWV